LTQNNWFLLHNAQAHRLLGFKEYLAEHNVTALEYPPYSRSLSQPDFFWFPWLKSVLEEQRFESVEEVTAGPKRARTGASKNFPRNASKGFANIGKRVSLPKGAALKEVFCK
jgi:predicted secreted protein